MTISSTNTKNSYSGDGTTVAFSYTFKILDDDDIQVILRTDATGTETVQTKTTDYTVSGVGNAGGGTITFGSAPAATETVVLLRNVPLTQTTDYTPNDPFPAATHEDALDKLTLMAQDTQEEVDRSIKLSRTNTMTSTEFTVGATTRANKIFAFDSSGELAVTQEIGTFQGDWAASTAYAERDLVKDTSTNNIFIVNSAHTSSGSQPLTTNPNSSKYDLIVDAAAATTSATNAASSATAAAASATAAAASESAAATSETNAAASEAGVAADAAAAAASAASASTSATNASTSETNASNSASAAATSATNAATSATNASNSASAAGTSESNAATSATNASNSASAAATSASNAATSESNASTSETNAATSASSAASDASAAATSAAAAAASFDAFDDIYLGAKASAPTVDNDGDALTEGDQYFNTTNNTLFVWNGSAWQAASPDIVGDTTPQLGGDLDTNGNDINFGDNDKAIFGAGSDLQVFHDATDSHVVTTNGDLNLQVAGAGTINLGDQFGNTLLKVVDNADVKLYHGTTPSEKLATTASGIDVTGTVTASSDFVTSGTFGSLYKSSDSQVLYIAGGNTNASGGNIRLYGGTHPTDASDILLRRGGTSVAKFDGGTGDISFYADNGTTQGLFWDASTQNLGVGTTSPSSEFTLAGRADITNAGLTQILDRTGSDGDIAIFQKDGTTVGSIRSEGGDIVFGNDTRGLKFRDADVIPRDMDNTTADGVVSLGSGTSRFQDLYLSGSATLANITNGAGEKIILNSDNMVFQVQASEAARIDSSGNLLVGTTTNLTGAQLSAGTTGIALRGDSDQIVVARDGGVSGIFNRNTSDGGIITFQKDGSDVGSIGTNESYAYISGTSRGLRFGHSGSDAQIVPVTASGQGSDDNVDLGSSGLRFQDLYLSGGAYIGGTVAANQLDDYEEGSFSPTVLGTVSSGTFTYNQRYGRYVKVGNQVTIHIYLEVNITVAGSGTLRIDDLPFTGHSSVYQALSTAHDTLSSSNAGAAFVQAGDDFMEFTDGGSTSRRGFPGTGVRYIFVGGTYLTQF